MESWLQRMMASRLPKFYEPCLAILLLAVEVFAGSRLCGRRSAIGLVVVCVFEVINGRLA